MTVFITGLATTSTTIGGGYSQRRETDSYCGSKQLETNPTRRKRTPVITPTQRQSNDEISLESEKSEIAGGAESEGAVPIKYWIAPSVELHCHRILNCFTLTDNFRLAWINSPQSPIPIIDGMRYGLVAGVGGRRINDNYSISIPIHADPFAVHFSCASTRAGSCSTQQTIKPSSSRTPNRASP